MTNDPGAKSGLPAALEGASTGVLESAADGFENSEEEAVMIGGTDLFGDPIHVPSRGRPSGARNKATKEWTELIAKSGMTPLEFCVKGYRGQLVNEGVYLDTKQKIQCAIGALPYVHQKQPISVQTDGGIVLLAIGNIDPDAIADAHEGLEVVDLTASEVTE